MLSAVGSGSSSLTGDLMGSMVKNVARNAAMVAMAAISGLLVRPRLIVAAPTAARVESARVEAMIQSFGMFILAVSVASGLALVRIQLLVLML
jgi:hypothetical protein